MTATLEGRVQKHHIKEDHVLVVISGSQCPTPITLSMELCDESRCISEGDIIWFDDVKIYWTPKGSNPHMPTDYPIKRVRGKGGSSDAEIRKSTYEAYKPTHGGYGGS